MAATKPAVFDVTPELLQSNSCRNMSCCCCCTAKHSPYTLVLWWNTTPTKFSGKTCLKRSAPQPYKALSICQRPNNLFLFLHRRPLPSGSPEECACQMQLEDTRTYLVCGMTPQRINWPTDTCNAGQQVPAHAPSTADSIHRCFRSCFKPTET